MPAALDILARPSARARSVTDLIGNTPLVRLRSVTRDLPPEVEVYAKLEHFNPGGSVKDRAAWRMVQEARADGRLHADSILIDSTSGNTGVAYAMLGAALGFPVHLVMPENVSTMRKEIAAAFGAQVILSDPLESSDGAIRHARRLIDADRASAHPRYFYPNQYANPANPRAHALTTAPEIWYATRGRVTHFVAGIGTSGTVMGTGAGLKRFNPAIQVIGLEPDDAFHGLEGLKHLQSSLVPDIYDPQRLDATRYINTEAGWDMTERLASEEGIFVGHSGGAACVGALQVAATLQRGVVVTVFPDHADRYIEP